ncbi:MAG: Fe-S cluster assembly protein HesB [Acidimicrobiia bacterium]|nr:Fe-S cluster assembly protein HesB [Acidimicrobiia bacterium]
MTRPKLLPYTAEPAANELLASNDVALIVGLVLYQQVPIEKAFIGPYLLAERLGGELDAATIAAYDPEELEGIFKEKPALHRFPGSMAKRVQAVCSSLVEEYGGEPSGLWSGDEMTAGTIKKRMMALPGFGEYKARVYLGVLAERFGLKPDGWEAVVPDWPYVGEIYDFAELDEFKARKKAWKESGS